MLPDNTMESDDANASVSDGITSGSKVVAVFTRRVESQAPLTADAAPGHAPLAPLVSLDAGGRPDARFT